MAAATTSAPSVGSPTMLQVSLSCTRWASLQRTAARRRSLRSSSSSLTGSDPRMNVPSGSYPTPVTSMVWPSSQMRRTVISFLVSVPVLSEQINVVQPSVSTAGSRLTMAFRLAILCTPMANAPVTTAGRASGTAATARLTPHRNISKSSFPLRTPRSDMTATTATEPTPSHCPISAILLSRGVSSSSTIWIISAILPNSVSMPVLTTTAFPRP